MSETTSFPFNNAMPTTTTDNNKYKKCIIDDCENDGDYFLICSSINKIGLFCKKCRAELEECGLVDFTSRDSFKKEGNRK